MTCKFCCIACCQPMKLKLAKPKTVTMLISHRNSGVRAMSQKQQAKLNAQRKVKGCMLTKTKLAYYL